MIYALSRIFEQYLKYFRAFFHDILRGSHEGSLKLNWKTWKYNYFWLGFYSSFWFFFFEGWTLSEFEFLMSFYFFLFTFYLFLLQKKFLRFVFFGVSCCFILEGGDFRNYNFFLSFNVQLISVFFLKCVIKFCDAINFYLECFN